MIFIFLKCGFTIVKLFVLLLGSDVMQLSLRSISIKQKLDHTIIIPLEKYLQDLEYTDLQSKIVLRLMKQKLL